MAHVNETIKSSLTTHKLYVTPVVKQTKVMSCKDHASYTIPRPFIPTPFPDLLSLNHSPTFYPYIIPRHFIPKSFPDLLFLHHFLTLQR